MNSQVGEQKIVWAVGEEGIGALDPVEGKILVRVSAWFEEVSNDTRAQCTYKEFNVKAAAATSWVVRDKDDSGYVMCGLGLGATSSGK